MICDVTGNATGIVHQLRAVFDCVITSKALCLFTNLKNAPGRSHIIVSCYPTMGQPDLGSETHISDIRTTHIGIPSNRENRRSAAAPLASTARHAAGRAARSPVPEHAEQWAKVWSREHTVSGHGQACRERFFAICAKKRIFAAPPACSSRAHTSPPGSVASYSSKSARSRPLSLCATTGGRSAVLGAPPNHVPRPFDLHAVEGRHGA